MKKKLSTYLSLLVMISSFITTPLTVLAETTSTTNSTQQTQADSTKPEESITKETDVSNAPQVESSVKETTETTTSDSSTLERTQTDQKQASETTQSTNQQTRAPNQTGSIKKSKLKILENSLSVTSSISYPPGQNYVTATSDWLKVTMNLTLPPMKTGETIKLTVANSEWDYSTEPFIVGDYTITPDSKKDGTFSIKSNIDTGTESIAVNMNIRYKENISSSKEIKEIPISIQYQNQVSNDSKSVEVHRFADTVPKNEIIKKVAYGIDKNGNALWGLFLNYNNFNLRGTDTAPFIFKDISNKGQKIIPESIMAYNVSNPKVEIDGVLERNTLHDDYNYNLSKYLMDNTENGIIDIMSTSSNPIGLDDITKSFYIFFATKPDKQIEPGEILSNKVDIQIAGENGETQKDDSEASVTVPPNNNGDQFIKISGTKTWNDANNQDGKRPDKITVNLLANGEQVATKAVTEADGWTYEFNDLPKFKDGNEIVYTVTENQVADYNTEVKGFNLTNSYTPGKTSVSVTKKWEDANNQDGKRPNSIQVQLLADGKKQGDVVELNAANNWTTTWNDLAQKANGKDIAYTIEEVKVPGYTTTVNDTDKGNILLTNTYTPETTEVKGTKTWNDANNQDGKRPDKITVNLLADGEQVATKEVTEADGWNYEFKDLPKFKDGQEIVYTVTENTVKDYTTKIKGYNITNTYNPGKISGTVTKRWEDANNQDGLRPDSIKIQLYANGKKQGQPVELTEKGHWTYSWKELDATDKDGKGIHYSIKEVDAVNGYAATITGENTGNLLITNTHTPTTPNKPKTPTKPETPSTPGKYLPKTGEINAIWWTVVGALLISSIGGYLYFRKKVER